MADDRMYIARLSQLAEASHDYGAKVAISLGAGAGAGAPDTLSTEQIEGLVKAYGIAAEIAKGSGLDAIEVNGHLGGVPDQFMTSLWNKRTDEYGGDLEGRLRFATEVIEAIKGAAGADFPVIYKYGLQHLVDGARETDEGVEIALRLEAAGADALDVDAGCWDTFHVVHAPTTQPPGINVAMAAMAKEAVNIPVIAVGKLGDPVLAESVLQEGKADIIMLGRPLLADPEWPQKVKAGTHEDIRPCIGCFEGCMARGVKYLSCAVNPSTGLERELVIEPAEKKKSVLVVGGGPGGMEAARVAALRGHEVALWEKGEALGGSLIPAAAPNFKLEYGALTKYLATQIDKLGVDITLGKEATAEQVKQVKPDVLFIATGTTPIVPEIPGIEKDKVGTAIDVLLGKKEVGESVAVLGGGIVGCETALYLARQGKQVTIVELLGKVARDMFFANRMHMMELLAENNTEILTETSLAEITDDGVVLVDNECKRSTLAIDTVVVALGLEPNQELEAALKDSVPETHAIGDCVGPRKVIDAMWEGFRLARLV
jgi:2-enoate reductase